MFDKGDESGLMAFMSVRFDREVNMSAQTNGGERKR